MNTTVKNIMMAIIAIFATVTVNAQSKSFTAADSIKALQQENAKLRNDLQAVTAAGQANSKGCMHLHVDTLRRVIKGVESCNGWMLGVGAGADMMKYEVADEGTSGNTNAAVVTAKFGYRHFWFRPEVYGSFGINNETMEGREYSMMRFGARVNIDFLRFKKVSHRHCPVDPYLFAGLNYTVVRSVKETGVGNIPYDGNQLRGEAGVGAMIKLGTFNNGRTTVNAGGKKVSLKKKSEIFLDINVPFSYGTLSKPRLTSDAKQPVMTCWNVTPTVSLVAKF